jgi:hypothetical protein
MRDIKMKVRNKQALVVALVVMLITLLGYFVLGYFVLRSNLGARIFLNFAIKQSQQRRVLLLCKTDHNALLKAGREILSQIPQDCLNPRPDEPRMLGDFGVPKEVQIPKVIQDLKPRRCLISYDGYLTLEMEAGMSHFGVWIYPADYKPPSRKFKYGNRELLPGLWYYDDGYIDNPEYDKRIDELIEEHKKDK